MLILSKRYFTSILFFLLIYSSFSYGRPSFKKILSGSISEISKGISRSIPIFDNFHTVEKGRLYRSSQLSKNKLNRKIKKYGIRTVINLRGENPGAAWWENEKAIVLANGASYQNIALSACRLPEKNEVLNLLDIFDNAEYPIYVHCRAGADRTGLACALYKMYIQGSSRKKAKKQLSFRYFHIKKKFPKMDEFIDMWQDRFWLMNIYEPGYL